MDVATRQDNWGIYLTDTFDVTEALALTFSGRYQITEVEIRDQTGDPENADLNGNHHFDRFNPAGGVTYSIFEDLKLLRRLQRELPGSHSGRIDLCRSGGPL